MSSEKTVYFVRHGESEANITPIFQPLDSPLTSRGKEQAAQIATRISHIPFDTLVCSPLMRARQTCEAISRTTGKDPEYSDLFVERFKPTELEGKPYSDAAASEMYKSWYESLFTPGVRVSNGENFDDLLVRTNAALDYLANKSENSIVVVTHGWFLRALFARILLDSSINGEVFKSFVSRTETENTGLSVLKFSEHYESTGWYVWIYNDHAHLG